MNQIKQGFIINDQFCKKDVIHYEIEILRSQTDLLNQERDDLEQQIKIKSDLDQKLYAAISKRAGIVVDKHNENAIKLPISIWGEIYDEVSGKQACLIRPSHQILPYSLIKKQPALQEYIPVQKLQPGITGSLQLLSDRSVSRALEIIKEYTSENTRIAHMGDLVYWQAWLSAIGFTFEKPITEKEILTYIVQHAEGLDVHVDKKLVEQRFKGKLGPHKLATIKRRIASLSVFLDSVKWPNPTRSKELTQLLKKLTKKYGSSKPAGKAITKDILDDVLAACEGTKLIDFRDRAMLLFAWGSGGRRRSEVTSADMKDLVRTPEDEFVYTIPRSKTDQEGNGHPVPVKGRVAKALIDWLTAASITEGPIFRSVAKGGHVRGALLPKDVYRIVKRRLKKAGYDESHFGAHSLRSGFVTEAGRRNKPLGDVMQLTTHRSIATVMRYYQAGSINNNSSSNLAD